MGLSNRVIADFQAALESAFTSATVTTMLHFQLNRKWTSYAKSADTFPHQLYALIVAADSEGWAHQLVLAAIRTNPGNPELRAFADRYVALTAPAPEPVPVASASTPVPPNPNPTPPFPVPHGRAAVGAPNSLDAYRKLITSGLPTTGLATIIQTLSDNLCLCDPDGATPADSVLGDWMRGTTSSVPVSLVLGQSFGEFRSCRDDRTIGDRKLTLAGTSDGVGGAVALAALARHSGATRDLKVDGWLDEWPEKCSRVTQSHLLVVGTADVNLYAAFLCGLVFDVSFGEWSDLGPSFHTHYQRINVRGKQYRRDRQRVSGRESHYGLVVLLQNPWNRDLRLLWVAGLSGVATHAGCRLVAGNWARYGHDAAEAVAVLYEAENAWDASPRAWLTRGTNDRPTWRFPPDGG